MELGFSFRLNKLQAKLIKYNLVLFLGPLKMYTFLIKYMKCMHYTKIISIDLEKWMIHYLN